MADKLTWTLTKTTFTEKRYSLTSRPVQKTFYRVYVPVADYIHLAMFVRSPELSRSRIWPVFRYRANIYSVVVVDDVCLLLRLRPSPSNSPLRLMLVRPFPLQQRSLSRSLSAASSIIKPCRNNIACPTLIRHSLISRAFPPFSSRLRRSAARACRNRIIWPSKPSVRVAMKRLAHARWNMYMDGTQTYLIMQLTNCTAAAAAAAAARHPNAKQ